MKINADNKKVLDSGIVHSFNMEDLEFTVSEEDNMILLIKVSGDRKNNEGSISAEVENDKLVVYIKNPHVVLNFGPTTPLKIGTIKDKYLYFLFRVNIFGEYEAYEISYTLYLEQ